MTVLTDAHFHLHSANKQRLYEQKKKLAEQQTINEEKSLDVCKRCNGNNYLKTENYSVLVENGAPETINCPDCTINTKETFTFKDRWRTRLQIGGKICVNY